MASRATVFSERECFRASWLLTSVQHVLHSLSRFCGRTPSNAYTVTTAKAQTQDCSWETKLCSKTEWYFTTVLLCGQRIISQMHLGYSKIIPTDPARKQNRSGAPLATCCRNCRYLLTDSHRSCRDERENRCSGAVQSCLLSAEGRRGWRS